MNVVVRSYGIMGDLIGKNLELDLPEESRLGDLARVLVAEYPDASAALRSCRFAIGDSFASTESYIGKGAIVAILPPFSGG